MENLATFFFFFNWSIWLSRNTWIFSGKTPSVQRTTLHCLDLVVAYLVKSIRRKNKNICVGPLIHDAAGFFDEAVTNSTGGVRAVLYIGSDHFYLIQLGCGLRTDIWE